nr:MAG TPA_asm: hypothetical protein [Bacteriophage sp.]
MLSLNFFLSRTNQCCWNIRSNSFGLFRRRRIDNYRTSILCIFIILYKIIKLHIIVISVLMCISMIMSCLNKTIHASKVSRIVLKRICIIALLLKSSSIILCRFSSKCCSVSSVHKPYVILNKICVTLICGISLTIPAYTTIIVLLSSNS